MKIKDMIAMTEEERKLLVCTRLRELLNDMPTPGMLTTVMSNKKRDEMVDFITDTLVLAHIGINTPGTI